MTTQEITSFDAAKPGVFGDILNSRSNKKKLKVGFLGAGYFEYWRMYPSLKETVGKDLEKLATALGENLDIVYPGMVDTLDAADKAGREFSKHAVDVVIIAEGTYLADFIVLHALEYVPDARIILFSTQTGYDVNPDDNYEATMRNSALIGIAQLSGTFVKAKRKYDVVVGEISDTEAHKKIISLAHVYGMVSRLRNFNIGLLGHVFRGMFDLEFDRGSVRGILGPEVITIQAEHLIDCWKEIPEEEAMSEAKEMFKKFSSKKITVDDLARSTRLGLAMEKLSVIYNLDAMCFLGQHYIEKMTGAPARIGASMMLENGFMIACEGDVGGLVTMEALHGFSGNIPVQLEWGQFDRKNNALFLLGHGIASPCMAKDNKSLTLTSAPEEWGFEGQGANPELIAKPGVVTLAHMLSTPDGWRVLISRGESLEYPCLPCDEVHAMVKVEKPVEEYLRELILKGVTHHVVMVHGDVTNNMQKLSDAMGLETFSI